MNSKGRIFNQSSPGNIDIASLKQRALQHYCRLSYKITVVTPIMGGGIDAGKPHLYDPISSKAIRGHLRFWWRMLYGHEANNSAELFEAESKLWGSTDESSPVEIEVEILNRGNEEQVQTLEKNRKNNWEWKWGEKYEQLAYILFPIQGEKRNREKEGKEAGFVRRNIKFQLEFRYPHDLKNDEEIQNAVRAWIHFGGVGARTRRGLGSLQCDSIEPASAELFKKEPFSSIFSDVRLGPGPENGTPYEAEQALGKAIEVYRIFRQGFRWTPTDNGIKKSSFGRSSWPEADTIRQHSGATYNQSKWEKGEHFIIPGRLRRYMPRAIFGLPIIFHFAQGRNGKLSLKDQNPDEAELLPVIGDSAKLRMASPIILKPLRVNERINERVNGRWVPAVLVFDFNRLNHMEQNELKVKMKYKKVENNQAKDDEEEFGFNSIVDPGLNTYSSTLESSKQNISPLANNGSGNAMEAFLNSLKKGWEVWK